MGCTVIGNRIRLTRGDTFRRVLTLTNEDTGEDYFPQEGDVVKFTLKKSTESTSELISITIPNDTMTLTIPPLLTKPLDFGDYVYDIQVTYANGDVDTVVEPTRFEISEEVG